VGNFGLTEIIILFLIILILFGSKRIPDLFRAVGSSIRNFKSGISEDKDHEKLKEDEKNRAV
jgi:sec-independent protein translocase protein TatA